MDSIEYKCRNCGYAVRDSFGRKKNDPFVFDTEPEFYVNMICQDCREIVNVIPFTNKKTDKREKKFIPYINTWKTDDEPKMIPRGESPDSCPLCGGKNITTWDRKSCPKCGEDDSIEVSGTIID